MEKNTENFEITKTIDSETASVEASSLKRGDLVMIKNRPCKVNFIEKHSLIQNQIIELCRRKINRYGKSRTELSAVDIFTGLVYQDMMPTTNSVEVPLTTTREYQLISIQEDGSMALMLDDGSIREDLKFIITDDSIRGVILSHISSFNFMPT